MRAIIRCILIGIPIGILFFTALLWLAVGDDTEWYVIVGLGCGLGLVAVPRYAGRRHPERGRDGRGRARRSPALSDPASVSDQPGSRFSSPAQVLGLDVLTVERGRVGGLEQPAHTLPIDAGGAPVDASKPKRAMSWTSARWR